MAASLIPALWNSLRVTSRALWRVTRQIFHEAMGTLFAVFALYGALAVWRQWHSRPVLWVMAFAIVYALMMAAWAYAAFRRARRVR
jgi:glycerol uptake facilitator-like aquaporin